MLLLIESSSEFRASSLLLLIESEMELTESTQSVEMLLLIETSSESRASSLLLLIESEIGLNRLNRISRGNAVDDRIVVRIQGSHDKRATEVYSLVRRVFHFICWRVVLFQARNQHAKASKRSHKKKDGRDLHFGFILEKKSLSREQEAKV
jgi:hypothetical protein